jgi:hypothetical protein
MAARYSNIINVFCSWGAIARIMRWDHLEPIPSPFFPYPWAGIGQLTN